MFKQKAFKEISFLWIGSLLGALATFLTQVLLARHLAPSDFGLFAAAFATIALITPLAGFGVAQYWLKVFGEEGYTAIRWMNGSHKFIIISTLIVMMLLFTWIYLGPNNTATSTVLAFLSLLIISQILIDLLNVRFQLEEKYLVLALWQLIPYLLRLILIVLLAFTSWVQFNLQTVSLIYFSVSILVVITGAKSLIQMLRGNINLKGHEPTTQLHSTSLIHPKSWSVMSNAWPFGLGTFFFLVYYQSNIILLNYLVSNESAGVYNVAFTVMAAVYLLPGVIYQKYLLPKMHRWANHDTEKFYDVYRYGIKSMFILGTIAMFGVWATSFWAIPLLFGKEYTNAVELLNILALSAPIIFLAFNAGATLVTKENMLRKVKYMGSVAVINIMLNVVLIPMYQEVGAAIATVISNGVLLYLYSVGTNKYVFQKRKIINVQAS